MDVAEAGRKKTCTLCGDIGHNYKKCPQMDVPGGADEGPSGNPADGAPPDFSGSSRTHSRSRHSIS